MTVYCLPDLAHSLPIKHTGSSRILASDVSGDEQGPGRSRAAMMTRTVAVLMASVPGRRTSLRAARRSRFWIEAT